MSAVVLVCGLLVHVLNTAPQLTEAADIRQRLQQFNEAAVADELATFERQGAGFERPYGWAWLLKLQAELLSSAEPSAKHAAHGLPQVPRQKGRTLRMLIITAVF